MQKETHFESSHCLSSPTMMGTLTVNFNPGAPSKHLGSSRSETVEGFFRPPFSFPSIGSQTANLLIQKRLLIGPYGPKSYAEIFMATIRSPYLLQLPYSKMFLGFLHQLPVHYQATWFLLGSDSHRLAINGLLGTQSQKKGVHFKHPSNLRFSLSKHPCY